MGKNRLVRPFLKWAGGKRQLLSEIRKYIPEDVQMYYEPFIGGGAVLFDVQPKKANVNDSNEELVNVYEVIRDNIDLLLKDLRTHLNTAEYYYKLREMDRDLDFKKKSSKVRRASRIIYLNKTCFNGIFRVNSQGQFNVPFGRYKNPKIVDEEVLRAIHTYLNENQVEFTCGDFEESITKLPRGTFVYLDPPYDPASDTSSFTGYTLHGFAKDEQYRLKKLCDKLHSRGIKFLLSNSATSFVLDLYKDYTIEIVDCHRYINSNANKRGKVSEVLVRNY